ncbi:hypothetical protein JMM81_03875 [Bacillus sp. V3B]|uniref:hypothetical protein n=1 Tax=Bacillus sp. V3B TaxID=2804915 RepID=UPI00210A34B6|nr:hypothetical protein [Bacillus sp. V3B]MCQ6274120.1 hypothetical protein [Bacillus sp. V3B]
MSFKSIEMQVAIPRTLDVGKLQEQLQQRGQNMSDQANEAIKKDVEQKRQHVIKSKNSAKAKLLKDGQKNDHEKNKRNCKREMKEEEQNEQHPYKGTIIDYSG